MNRNGAPAPQAADAPAFDRRILILAPLGNDARLTADFLSNARLNADICVNALNLAEEISLGCGAIILAEEALGHHSVSTLVQTLAKQPAWSDIPIVLITSGGEAGQTQLRRLAMFSPGGNVILLERPFRPGTLLSILEMALRARQRQYEARDSVLKLERAHAEVQAASRAKDEFLAALSHELRTPLNPVLLVASDRARTPDLAAGVRADFELIRKNIELEARLIDDLLDLTRIARGKLPLAKQAVDLHQVLRDALATVAEEIRQKNITVTQNFTAKNVTILGDAVRLQQIFWNVLKNAVKFTPAHGCITMATQEADAEGKVSVKITDTGIGLTGEEIGHIFNAFSQGEHAYRGGSHRFGGLGLGLAISRMLVELHGGSIRAESAGRDQGATFTVELSALKIPDAPPPRRLSPKPLNAASAPSSKPGGLRVLLVEDHEPTRMALANLLARRDYQVSAAVTVAEALEYAGRENFDLVVSDIGLPDGNGYSLMTRLRDEFGLKGIALTGYGMEQDVARGQRAGFMAHLIKPVRVESLEKALCDITFA